MTILMAEIEEKNTKTLVTHGALAAQFVDKEVHDVLGMAIQLFAEVGEVDDGSFLASNTLRLGWLENDFRFFSCIGRELPSSGLFLLRSSTARLSSWAYLF